MATVLFASWNRLHYEGQISYIEQHCSAAILPGHTLNITGGSIPAWASMQAIIQETTLNLGNRLNRRHFRPLRPPRSRQPDRRFSGRLTVDSFCYRRQSRDAPDSSSGDLPRNRLNRQLQQLRRRPRRSNSPPPNCRQRRLRSHPLNRPRSSLHQASAPPPTPPPPASPFTRW